MPNVRALNQKKYGISPHRHAELRHFCMQYDEWKEELRWKTDTVQAVDPSREYVPAGDHADPTARLAERREQLSKQCRLVEDTAKEADPDIWEWLVKAVTNEGVTYDRLEAQGLPCGRDRFYDRRRKFFWLLDKKDV